MQVDVERKLERKDEILAFLTAHGPATLDSVSAHLGVTRQAALKHLSSLEGEGLVASESESEHRHSGRPRHLFRATQAARNRLPQDHRALATELVHFLDAAQLERFFAQRAARIEAEYALRLAGKTGRERIEELARMATEKGHMANVVEMEDGSLGIRHCHCPIGDVAAETRLPCREEQEMYSRLLGAEVSRTSFMPESASSCTYVVATAKTGRNRRTSRSRRLAAAN